MGKLNKSPASAELRSTVRADFVSPKDADSWPNETMGFGLNEEEATDHATGILAMVRDKKLKGTKSLIQVTIWPDKRITTIRRLPKASKK